MFSAVEAAERDGSSLKVQNWSIKSQRERITALWTSSGESGWSRWRQSCVSVNGSLDWGKYRGWAEEEEAIQ
jgi:hypothetical protein